MRDFHSIEFVLAVYVFLVPNLSQAQMPDRRQLNPAQGQFVEHTLKQLSVEEKIGQMLQIRVWADYADSSDPAFLFVTNQIHKYHIGSVDLGARMLGPKLVKG